ncbi:Deoxycytidine monophosphate (dCMP) deaminase [Clarireedia jacksonii]
MLIGLCGGEYGICAGKSTIAQYLVDHHGFSYLYLQPSSSSKLHTNGEIDQSITSNSDETSANSRALVTTQENGLHSRSKPPSNSHTFNSPDDLLDFVTKRWRERWVTADIHNESILDKLFRRPFFILISVDAPVSVRWQRYQARRPRSPQQPSSLEDFLLRSDAHLYDPNHGLQSLISRATIRLLNTSSDLAHLYATLGKLDLTNENRLRPSWDQYFMQLASLAAQRSNCMKRRVGCVLVREKRVISTGYNGTPRGLVNCGEGGCARCNSAQSSGVGLGTCLCLHAEENALLEAGRDRVGGEAILYCDTCPCLTCSIKIAQVGIKEVVYSQGYSMDADTEKVFAKAGVRLRQFTPPANGLIHLEKPTLH